MPLDPDDVSRLRDVITYAGKVQAMVDGLSQASFVADTKTFFAVCYGIQVVGEAAWKLSDGMKKAHTTIPWPLIAGMRHRLVHDYGRTDENVVYQVATIHLPKLVQQIKEILVAEGLSQ
jgi:uncharacterized protein with HEPN domain